MDAIIASRRRVAIPIMTHPGIELIGKRVIDAVTDGQTHFEAIRVMHERFPEAAACTVIMDLTVEAEAFGARLHMPEDEVPSVRDRLLTGAADVEALRVPDPVQSKRLCEYLKANRLAAEFFDKPVFGGCIGPFSLAGRLFDMTEIMMAIYTDPATVESLLEKCTAFVIRYLHAMRQTGVAGVILAEPAAGLLSNDDCMQFSSRYVREIVEKIQSPEFAVVLHNCGNTGHCTPAMIATGAMGYHFGNRADMVEALAASPGTALVMGNLDPVALLRNALPQQVRDAARELLERTASFPNFVLSTGCDTPPGVPFENIEALFDALS